MRYDKDREDLYKKAIKVFGHEAQILMVFEEMGELMQAISKYDRGVWDLESLAEEIADVSIMMEQLCVLYNIRDLVHRKQNSKLFALDSLIREKLSDI